MPSKMEVLAAAISYVNEFHMPESVSFRLNNPGLLKAKSLEQMGLANDDNIRIFSTRHGGEQALLKAIRDKCVRYKNARLYEALAYLNVINPDLVVDYFHRAGESDIQKETSLKYFL